MPGGNAGRFLHHKKVLFPWLCGFGVTCLIGGSAFFLILCFGLVITYLLDLLGFREATLMSLWLSFFGGMLQLLIATSPFVNYSVFNTGLMMALILFAVLSSLWCSLHFRWLRDLHPAFPSFSERVVLSALPLVSATLSAWALGALSSDLSLTAYQLAALLLLFDYHLRPASLASSFPLPARPLAPALGPFEDRALSAIRTCFPALVHLAIFWPQLPSRLVFHDLVLLV
ncbi:MAG: hypothetical protein Q8P67_09330, partial [archaeon]|nr:hypothetical protein [archaeon]